MIAEHKTSAVDYEGEEEDGYDVVWYEERYQILRCRGCGSICFCQVSSDTMDVNPKTGEPEEWVRVFPGRRVEKRKPIEGASAFKPQILTVYREVLAALGAGCLQLSALGVRALIESVCLQEKCKSGNLKTKIDALVKKEVISRKQAEILQATRFLGNDAAHKIKKPDEQEVHAAIDIAETMLKTLYILPFLRKRIKSKQKSNRQRKRPTTTLTGT